jgi:hypothetical protein
MGIAAAPDSIATNVATSGSGPSTSSTNEFHELHDEHWPDHFGWLAAHDVQR